jgi:N-carbamoylputrescine amidase
MDADGSLLGVYRKMHIPDDPLYYEKFYFAPGDLGFRAWPTRYGKIGVLRLLGPMVSRSGPPDRVAGGGNSVLSHRHRLASGEKAEQGAIQHGAWETIQRSHAIANGCFVAAVNRVGWEKPAGEPGLEFWGQSFVAGTSGEILARAAVDQEETLIVPVDLRRWKPPAPTGPSCATAALTPTAI